MSWQLTVFSGRKLGQYADQELGSDLEIPFPKENFGRKRKIYIDQCA